MKMSLGQILNTKPLCVPGEPQTIQRDYKVCAGKSGFNTLLPAKAGNSQAFLQAINKATV